MSLCDDCINNWQVHMTRKKYISYHLKGSKYVPEVADEFYWEELKPRSDIKQIPAYTKYIDDCACMSTYSREYWVCQEKPPALTNR